MLTRRNRNSRQLLLRRGLLIISLTLLAFAITVAILIVLIKAVQSNSVPISINSATIGKQKVKIGVPIKLTIPKISIEADIAYVGVAADGSMDISPNQDDVAWYEYGPRPGDIGSAVIAGHYGSLNGKFSVFSNLSKLEIGDKLQVQDHTGLLVAFVVREIRSYDPKADATDIFKSNDGKAHLNLITCEGSWNQAKETYSSRLVIFTDKDMGS
ncbi:class F sortase [Candidatus Saccharibacteria bacterium]|nr:class F sortase [Candidatus Saccharibacteria bacterium]